MAKHPEVGRLNESQPRVPQHQKVISLMISCQDYLVLSLLALNFPFSTYALLWNQAPLFLMLCGLGWRGRLKWEDFQACQLNKTSVKDDSSDTLGDGEPLVSPLDL